MDRMTENFWDLGGDSYSTANIKRIIKEQEEYLKTSTNGAIRSKFAKIKNISPIVEITTALGESAASYGAMLNVEVVGNEYNESLKDANDLYKTARYGFEIYNDTYKFRIFEIVLAPVYPINMILDEGIFKDIGGELSKIVDIEENTEVLYIETDIKFTNVLKLVLSSRKLKFILLKMLNG